MKSGEGQNMSFSAGSGRRNRKSGFNATKDLMNRWDEQERSRPRRRIVNEGFVWCAAYPLPFPAGYSLC
jgi:hypothetical protein